MLICLNGGLGNQIGNYIFARYILENTEIAANIGCKIIASNKVNETRDIVLDKLGIKLDFASKEDIEHFINTKTNPVLLFNLLSKNIYNKIWRNNLWNLLKRIRAEYNIYPKKTLSLLSKTVSYKDVLKYGCYDTAVCDCYSPIEEFNDEKFKEKMRHTLFSNDEKLLVGGGNSYMLKKITESKNPVGVHIRRGDFIDFNIPVVKKEFIIEKMKFIEENFEDAHFFIFSNDQKWAKANIKGFKDVDFVDINDEESGYLDFLLFNRCRHRIYSNSTFSLWIKYFNPYKDSIEFYPNGSHLQREEKKC